MKQQQHTPLSTTNTRTMINMLGLIDKGYKLTKSINF